MHSCRKENKIEVINLSKETEEWLKADKNYLPLTQFASFKTMIDTDTK